MDNNTLTLAMLAVSAIAGMSSALVVTKQNYGDSVPLKLSVARYTAWVVLGALCVVAVQRYLSA